MNHQKTLVQTRPFPTRPSLHFIEKFKNYVAETGRPHEWPFLDHSVPPKDADFEELSSFEIPEKLRSRVGMAPCSICSPDKPKYFVGRLCWFLEEGVLRVIGHECAETHFGVERNNAAIQARKRLEALNYAENFLLDNIPKLARREKEVRHLQGIARKADSFRRAIWKQSSKKDWVNLKKQAPDGLLNVESLQLIASRDRYGKEHSTYSAQTTASFTVLGLRYLGRSNSIEAIARNALQAICSIEARNEDEALEYVTEVLNNEEDLLSVSQLMQGVVTEIDKLNVELEEVRRFLQPENLNQLSAWSLHPDSLASFSVHFSKKNLNYMTVRSSPARAWPLDIPLELREFSRVF